MSHKRKDKSSPRRIIIISILFILTIFNPITLGQVGAASANLTLSCLSEQIRVGDTFSIAFTVQSTAGIQELETYISYDQNVLEFVQGGSNVDEDSGKLFISDSEMSGVKTKKYIMQFKAIAATQATNVTIDRSKQDPLLYGTDGVAISTSSKDLSITVMKQGEIINQKKNITLEALSVKEGALNPTFASDTSSYRVTVEENVTKVTIDAKATEAADTVTVVGGERLYSGDNVVSIIVTTPEGDNKEYTIVVHRQGTNSPIKSEDNNNQTEDQEAMAPGKNIIYHGEKVIQIEASATYDTVPIEETNIPSGYKATMMNIQSVKVPVLMKEEQTVQDYVFLYLSKEGTTPEYYQYCVLDGSLQKARLQEENQSSGTETDTTKEHYYKTIIGILIAIIVLMIGVILTLFVLIYLIKKENIDKI